MIVYVSPQTLIDTIEALGAAYDRLLDDAAQGQLADEEEIKELTAQLRACQDDLQAERTQTEGMRREIASLGDINATLRLGTKKLQEELDAASAEIVKLNDEQDAAWARGRLILADKRPTWHGYAVSSLSGVAADEADAEALLRERQEPGGDLYPGTAADDREQGITRKGGSMLVAHVEAIKVRPGDRIRFQGYSGNSFVTVLAVHHRGKRVDLTVRIPRNDALPSLPYGDHCFTLEHNAVVERNENP